MVKVVIDAGHGGTDPGASGNGIIEKNKTLEISEYMYERLKDLGIDVSMTRTSDETLGPSERVKRILAPYGNKSDVIIISNHINAGGADGAEVIYALRNDGKLANLVLDELELSGQNVRKAYQRRLPSDTSKDYYFIHRDTGITEPIIVEYGFLDSTGDDVNQLKNNWKDLVEGVIKGVIEYLNEEYDQDLEGYYTVLKGDTLWTIARNNNTTVAELKTLNNLASNYLSVGQKLRLPENKNILETGVYVVKAGDTLYSIAKKFNTTVQNLMEYNDLKTNNLSIGMSLNILNFISKNDSNDIKYIVKKGDNLYTIASNYDKTIKEIMDYNNLSTNLLTIGQEILIPSDNLYYIVKMGDSLYSIARRYNTTVDSLRIKNNLTNSLLSIGQKIII